jgi:hypothetical protein
VAAKPTPAAPTAPVVIPVAPGPTTPPAEAKPATTPVEAAKSAPTIADLPAGGPSEKPAGTETPEANLWKPATKKKPVQKAALVDPLADDAAKSAPKPAVATTPKPKPAEPAVAAATPKPTVAATPKPAAGKAKKPTKVWVDPFAN